MTTDAIPGGVIHPTHSCFDDAIEFLSRRVTENPARAHETRLRLVHGIAIALSDVADGLVHGEPFAHAWVEEDVPGEPEPRIWQSGILNGQQIFFAMTSSEFARQLEIRARTVYTIRQVYHENRRSGTYGPWPAAYRALCRRAAEGGS